MSRFLDYGIGKEIEALQSLSWNGKAIKVFLKGDYDFMCKVFGLSGPQGTFPCLWCQMPRKAMHATKSEYSQEYSSRNLSDLYKEHEEFMMAYN